MKAYEVREYKGKWAIYCKPLSKWMLDNALMFIMSDDNIDESELVKIYDSEDGAQKVCDALNSMKVGHQQKTIAELLENFSIDDCLKEWEFED